MCACHAIHEEIRGQLSGVGSHLPPSHSLIELGSLVSAVLCTPGLCLAAGVLGIQEHTITPGYLGRGDLGSSQGRLGKQVTFTH